MVPVRAGSASCGSLFRHGVLTALVLPLCVAAPAVLADGTVRGNGRFERIRSRPGQGFIELYESNLFLSRDGGGIRGPSYRLGAPPGEAPRGDGYYSLSVPAGSYSILVNQPLFFIRPKVLSGVLVRDGALTLQHVELPIDYSTFFTDEWTTFEDVWLQMFAARGTSITGVSWKLAGTNATVVECSILEDNGNADPSAWPRVSARAARRDSVAPVTDNWVRWRSGEVPTVPGRRYAVRLQGVSGGDRRFSVFRRPKDANSYQGGSAYRAGNSTARGYDLNITVFSDNDGTAVVLNKTTEGLGELRDGNYGGRWGHTFRPGTGTSLAAVDVWAAGADNNWDIDFTWRVYRGGPGGAPVGPVKTTRAAFQAFGAGLHGVSYSRGEVPLEAGETYYVEFTGSPGFNPYVMADPQDAYVDGAPYQDGALRSGFELSMTVIVYTTGPGKTGTVEGRVRDADSSLGLSGATVRIVELGLEAATGAGGAYDLAGVPPGTYSLEASKPGYATETRMGVPVAANASTTADFSLALEPCLLQFRSPGFEAGLTGWTRYGEARDRVVDTSGGAWFADIRAYEGNRFHGNEINGCCLEGGLYQRVCAVPGHRYRVSVWSNIYWIQGDSGDAVNRIGIDPNGAVDPAGTGVVWSAPHRQLRSSTQGWSQLAVEAVASGPVLTLFLDFRQLPATGNQWRINCFDLVEMEDLDASRPPAFLRGDCDANGREEISDAIFGLNFLFTGGREPVCGDACDSNDDGSLDLSDALYFLQYLFLGGPKPPAPSPGCGEDGTPEDAVECGESTCTA